MAERKIAESFVTRPIEEHTYCLPANQGRLKVVKEHGPNSFTVAIVTIEFNGTIPVEVLVVTAMRMSRRPK